MSMLPGNDNEPPKLRGVIQWQDDIASARRLSQRIHPSRKWEPLKMLQIQTSKTVVFEQWQNSIYDVTVRRYINGSALHKINGRPEFTYLGICSADGSARHDWRDMQRIKNQIVGEDWEGLELFPAEKRLLDPSNLFIIWCYPAIPIGSFEQRRVKNAKTCIAPQRGWAKEDEPEDAG
jgi:hypothetical protein